jgi:hypothetical protein
MANSDPKKLEFLSHLWAPLGILVTAAIGVWQVYDARSDAEIVRQALGAKEAELTEAQSANDALTTISLPGFLQKYDAHIAELKKASSAYEKAKTAKGVNISGSDQAGALASAEKELNAACDKFTDYVDRWRVVAQSLNNLLDGNVTHLENSRRENNPGDISAAANRIINAAPDLATPFRIAFSNGSRAEALRCVDAFGCLRSLRARSALDGVSWVQRGSVEIAVGQRLATATQFAPSSAPSLGRRSAWELDSASCLVACRA